MGCPGTPFPARAGHRAARRHAHREILNAIFYLLRSGCDAIADFLYRPVKIRGPSLNRPARDVERLVEALSLKALLGVVGQEDAPQDRIGHVPVPSLELP